MHVHRLRPHAVGVGCPPSRLVLRRVVAGSMWGVLTVRSDDQARPTIDVEISGAGFQPATAPVYLHTRGDLYSLDPATMQLVVTLELPPRRNSDEKTGRLLRRVYDPVR